MIASMMSCQERAMTNLRLVGENDPMPRRGRSLTPPQSRWCWLGFHHWACLSRYQRKNGILYEVSYQRCDRLGCRRYPEWSRVDVSRVKR